MRLKINDVEFGYDRAGQGEPVLLVMGMATPRIGWFPQATVLSQRYDVTTFDNRGCGETVCDGPWTMLDMANDAVAIADAMGYERFHLIGISMGGMISQEVVLNYSDRVRSLTLMATSPGGPEAVPMTAEYAQALALPDPAERARKSIELTFGATFRREHPEVIELVLAATMSGQAGVTPIGELASPGLLNQMTASAMWMVSGGAASRLGEVEAPTLVIHGTDDLLIPVANGQLLARVIPGARLRIFEDAGHAVNAERPEEVNAELVSHLESASAKV